MLLISCYFNTLKVFFFCSLHVELLKLSVVLVFVESFYLLLKLILKIERKIYLSKKLSFVHKDACNGYRIILSDVSRRNYVFCKPYCARFLLLS